MASAHMNASCTREDLAREFTATYIHHTSGSEPDHLGPVNDNTEADHARGTRNEAPEHPQQYWQRNESVSGLQVVPEQPGLQVAEDKEVALDSVNELKKRGRFRQSMGRRACGIPFWALLLLATLLIIGAIIGGILGGITKKATDKKQPSSCHLIVNSTVCGSRLSTLPSASNLQIGTPHPLPSNWTWYYLATQPASSPGLSLALSVSSNGALNVTSLGTHPNISSELWAFVNFEDLALVNPHDYFQSQANMLRTYRRRWNITNPLYVVHSAVWTNATYLRLDSNSQPYLSQQAPSRYMFEEEVFWYLEDRYDPGDFLLRNADIRRNETALAVWDIRGGAGRLIMSDGADEIKANGAWRTLPFGSPQ